MLLKFRNKQITGIVTALPETVVQFDDEAENYGFPMKQTQRLKKIMGFKQHRVAKESTATSDLSVFALNYALSTGELKRDEISVLIVVTATPDHFMPNVSNIVQDKCGLSQNVLCIDLAQGCVGFIVGLMESFLLLEHIQGKAVLINADVLSHKVSKQDRNSYPLIGDCATVTVIENKPSNEIVFNIEMDGSRGSALCIPAGGSRLPCSADTAKLETDADGNTRSLDNLKMDGTAVFQYVTHDAPQIILNTLEETGFTQDQVDWFLFHQPNRFMLRKLAEAIGVPYEKMPMNIVEEYGNPSGASIPLCITHNLSEQMTNRKQLCCLAAFGSGLACGAIVMELGEMDFCETIVSNL